MFFLISVVSVILNCAYSLMIQNVDKTFVFDQQVCKVTVRPYLPYVMPQPVYFSETMQRVAGVSAGVVVLIVVLVLFIICALIDVVCYFLNQCGFIMFVCINCCGRQPPEHSMKQRDMHQLEEANKLVVCIRAVWVCCEHGMLVSMSGW